jgi:hypothetical protein
MRGIRARIEITQQGIDKGHRYWISTTNGNDPHTYLLAGNKDIYSADYAWRTLLGDPNTSIVTSSPSQNLSISIWRQIPNPHFDPHNPKDYQSGKDWQCGIDVNGFRLYNPPLARPYLQWDLGGRWGDEVPFSEGDQHQYAYDIEKIWDDRYDYVTPEKGVQWTVRRLDDSDNFKEFVIKLSV